MLIKGSFDDYIYILVGVIWLAFSIYKGVQKKKAAQEKETESDNGETQSPKKSIFEDFLNQLVSEEEPVPYQPTENEESNKKEEIVVEAGNETELFSYDDVYEESNYLEKTDVFKEESPIKPTLKTSEKAHKKRITKKSRFNLRRAIVYSEILNRPYS